MTSHKTPRKTPPSLTATRVRQRRESLGMGQEDLALAVGYTDRSAITQIERGKNEVKLNKLVFFAQALHTSTAYLLGIIDDPNLLEMEATEIERRQLITSDTGSDSDKPLLLMDNDKKPPQVAHDTVKIPILGEVAAGMGAYADNNVTGYEYIPTEWIHSQEDHVLLRVQGDSMYPVFMEDDLLLVKCQPVVESGSYAVVLIDDDNGVVKQIIHRNNAIELRSINPAYPPRRFEGADMERLRIFGLVKKSIRNYE